MPKRLFFTKFGWENQSNEEISRSLKLFALINNELVVPSKHIYSMHAEQFFRTYPELLEKGILRPAMDPKYSSYSDYFSQRDREAKAGRSLSSYGQFLDSIQTYPVEYSDTVPARIFTECAVNQFADADSVLSRAAKFPRNKAKQFLDSLLVVGAATDGFVYFEEFVDVAKRIFNQEELVVVEKFAELNRLMAGAASKDCNNLLPQENLIDWCLANPANPSDFILNDEKIFWEVFLESIVRISDGIFSIRDLDKLSPQVLDRFSFLEIEEIRADSVRQDSFINRYDSIVSQIDALPSLKNSPHQLLDYEQLILAKERIRAAFDSAMYYERFLALEVEKLEAIMKVAYQIWGGSIQTVTSIINYFSVNYRSKMQWARFLEIQEQRIERATKWARNRLYDEPVLIEYMEMILKKSKDAWHK